ncbi:hypothetical protein WJX73_002078 [Symbiochloris irregularis]|uniref:Uncharacterized protein n=1 Tax=Symbiochloris irregularis TaxID=706552 RepID=A0AAW1NQR4_9CHLO
MTTEQVTTDQAWNMLPEKEQRALISETADKDAAFREELFRRAKKAAEKLYQRDWKAEAKEAAHGTMGCSYPQEEAIADEMAGKTMDDIFHTLQSAVPFLPASFIAETSLTVLETFVKGEYATHSLAEELLDFTDQLIKNTPDIANSGRLHSRYERVESKLDI